MKCILCGVLIVILVQQARAQSLQGVEPFKASPGNPPEQQIVRNLHLEKWRDFATPASPSPGVLFYFDYTKLFEWLLPKKHAKVPPECDPMLMPDSIWQHPSIMPDSIPNGKQPV